MCMFKKQEKKVRVGVCFPPKPPPSTPQLPPPQGSQSRVLRLYGGAKAKHVAMVGLGKSAKLAVAPEWGASPFQVRRERREGEGGGCYIPDYPQFEGVARNSSIAGVVCCGR